MVNKGRIPMVVKFMVRLNLHYEVFYLMSDDWYAVFLKIRLLIITKLIAPRKTLLINFQMLKFDC